MTDDDETLPGDRAARLAMLAETSLTSDAQGRLDAGPPGAAVSNENSPVDAPVAVEKTPLRTARPQRRPSEWVQAKSSFVSIMEEADVAIRVFDQEKRRILGITHALSQIEQSFERLHTRFDDIEKRVASFAQDDAQLREQFEASFVAIAQREDREAELLKDNIALRAAVAGTERQLMQHAEAIRLVADNNEELRDKLALLEQDTGLIVDHIARLRNEIVMRPPSDHRAATAETVKRMSPPPRAAEVPIAAAPPPPPRPTPVVDDLALLEKSGLGKLITDINNSIEFHREELTRLRSQIEHLPQPADLAEERPSRPAARTDDRQSQIDAIVAPARVVCDEKLAELKSLVGSYQDVVRNLEQSRTAVVNRSPDVDEPAELASLDLSDSVLAPAVHDALRSDRSAVEPPRPVAPDTRASDLKAELLRERQERRFAEGALQVARQERLLLQRELAKLRANGWRTIPVDPDASASAAPDQPTGKREISAA